MKHNSKLVTVYSKDGMYLIKTPNGETMPCLQWIRVSDNWPNQPYLIARMDCNIANNNEPFDEPIKLYNQSEVDNIKNGYQKKIEAINHASEIDIKSIKYLSDELNKIESKWWFGIMKWFYKGKL